MRFQPRLLGTDVTRQFRDSLLENTARENFGISLEQSLSLSVGHLYLLRVSPAPPIALNGWQSRIMEYWAVFSVLVGQW